MNQDIIFHHYPTSPFSEKVRAIFGYKKLAWKSVLIPVIMPKPDVIALTGGYRRTPVMQIGSDIYCDTALICDVLESIAPSPTLYPPENADLARLLAQWADTTLFWTAIAYSFQPAGMAAVFKDAPPEAVKAFAEDRKAFRGGAPRMHPSEATGALRIYLNQLSGMLASGQSFLLSGQPGIADFSVYHCLWYVRNAGEMARILDPHPALLAWMDRIKAFGHGASERMSSAQAIEVAKAAGASKHKVLMADAHGLALGDAVTIAATDYGSDPVSGTLAINGINHIALRRTDERAGEVTVHFPRIGFAIKKNVQEA